MPGQLRPAVHLAGVTKTYGRDRTAITALHRTDLDVGRGELVAVAGPSGSGKSTMLAIIGGLLTPDAGTVDVDGIDVAALRRGARARYRASKVGFVFQSFNLVPFLTARENLLLMASLAGLARSVARRRADTLLAELGLTGRGSELPGRLSGGEQQRVAIARALIHEPAVLLADEPTASLDSERGMAVVELLRQQAHGRRTAVVFVTHDLRMADMADRVVNVIDGRLTEKSESGRTAGTSSDGRTAGTPGAEVR